MKFVVWNNVDKKECVFIVWILHFTYKALIAINRLYADFTSKFYLVYTSESMDTQIKYKRTQKNAFGSIRFTRTYF